MSLEAPAKSVTSVDTITDENFNDFIAKNPNAVIFVSDDDSPLCKTYAETFSALAGQYTDRNVRFGQGNVNTSKELLKANGGGHTHGIPMTLFYKDGQYKGGLINSPDSLSRCIEKYLPPEKK